MAQPRAEIRLEAKERGAVAALQRFGKAYGEMAMAINQSMEVIGKVAGGVAKSISLVSGAIAEAVQLSGVQIKAEKELAAVLKAKGQYTEEQYKSMLDYASAIQQVTTYGDEEVIAIQKRLAARDIEASKINQATKMFIGYREAGVEAEAAAKAVEALMKGKSADALREYGLEWQNVGKAIDQANGFFGIAEDNANTFVGKLKQFVNAVGDIKEAIGDAITKSAPIQGIIDALKNAVTTFTGGAKEAGLAGIIDSLGRALAGFMANLAPWIMTFYKTGVLIGNAVEFWAKKAAPNLIEAQIKTIDEKLAKLAADNGGAAFLESQTQARAGPAAMYRSLRAKRWELEKEKNNDFWGPAQASLEAGIKQLTADLRASANAISQAVADAVSAPNKPGSPTGSGSSGGTDPLDAAMANLDKEKAFRDHHRQALDAELEVDRQREERRAQIIKEGNDKLAQYWEERYNYQREMEERQNKEAKESNDEYTAIMNQGMATLVQGLSSGITQAIQAAVNGERLVDVLRSVFGGIISSWGQMLIFAGTASLADLLIPGIAAMMGLSSPMGPAGAIAAIALGTSLVAAGAAMSKSAKNSARASAAQAKARPSIGSASRPSGFNQDTERTIAGPRIINISFRGPVTNPKRVAREIEDALVGAT